jgi:murein DD-endopeptidase MepM/ murein hydrolase activator NlpD
VLLRLSAVLLLAAGTALGPAPAAAAPPPSPPPAGAWVLPLAGSLTRGFDPPADRFGRGHRGVDLAGSPGAPVRAAGDGVVVFAGMLAGRPVISIEHPGGLRTTYEPVEPVVAAGRPVSRGSVIGTLIAGHSGCPVAACLHWGLRRGDVYLDPLALLELAQVRLLPLSSAGSLAASRSYSSARL